MRSERMQLIIFRRALLAGKLFVYFNIFGCQCIDVHYLECGRYHNHNMRHTFS